MTPQEQELSDAGFMFGTGPMTTTTRFATSQLSSNRGFWIKHINGIHTMLVIVDPASGLMEVYVSEIMSEGKYQGTHPFSIEILTAIAALYNL